MSTHWHPAHLSQLLSRFSKQDAKKDLLRSIQPKARASLIRVNAPVENMDAVREGKIMNCLLFFSASYFVCSLFGRETRVSELKNGILLLQLSFVLVHTPVVFFFKQCQCHPSSFFTLRCIAHAKSEHPDKKCNNLKERYAPCPYGCQASLNLFSLPRRYLMVSTNSTFNLFIKTTLTQTVLNTRIPSAAVNTEAKRIGAATYAISCVRLIHAHRDSLVSQTHLHKVFPLLNQTKKKTYIHGASYD